MASFVRILLRLFSGLLYVDLLLFSLSDTSYLVMTLCHEHKHPTVYRPQFLTGRP
jgi:hypothetical protein